VLSSSASGLGSSASFWLICFSDREIGIFLTFFGLICVVMACVSFIYLQILFWVMEINLVPFDYLLCLSVIVWSMWPSLSGPSCFLRCSMIGCVLFYTVLVSVSSIFWAVLVALFCLITGNYQLPAYVSFVDLVYWCHVHCVVYFFLFKVGILCLGSLSLSASFTPLHPSCDH